MPQRIYSDQERADALAVLDALPPDARTGAPSLTRAASLTGVNRTTLRVWQSERASWTPVQPSPPASSPTNHDADNSNPLAATLPPTRDPTMPPVQPIRGGHGPDRSDPTLEPGKEANKRLIAQLQRNQERVAAAIDKAIEQAEQALEGAGPAELMGVARVLEALAKVREQAHAQALNLYRGRPNSWSAGQGNGSGGNYFSIGNAVFVDELTARREVQTAALKRQLNAKERSEERA